MIDQKNHLHVLAEILVLGFTDHNNCLFTKCMHICYICLSVCSAWEKTTQSISTKPATNISTTPYGCTQSPAYNGQGGWWGRGPDNLQKRSEAVRDIFLWLSLNKFGWYENSLELVWKPPTRWIYHKWCDHLPGIQPNSKLASTLSCVLIADILASINMTTLICKPLWSVKNNTSIQMPTLRNLKSLIPLCKVNISRLR